MYEDTIDYFPTPNDLAEQMAKSIAKKVHNINLAPGPILEPSAGTGNLVKAMDRVFSHGSDTKLDIDCIELSSSCRAILKKEGFRVVHDDFLTYKPHKRYKAIVMNPPFSDGIAHLKKAISIMQNGGAIRCILPAESIRHPHTREQIDLVNTLTDLKADIGYYKDAFVNSERPTKIAHFRFPLTKTSTNPIRSMLTRPAKLSRCWKMITSRMQVLRRTTGMSMHTSRSIPTTSATLTIGTP